MEDEALDWGEDYLDEEFLFNKPSDANNMKGLTPMAWDHYDAYKDNITPSVFSSSGYISTDLLSNQGWLPHQLDRSVGSSIYIYSREAVAIILSANACPPIVPNVRIQILNLPLNQTRSISLQIQELQLPLQMT